MYILKEEMVIPYDLIETFEQLSMREFYCEKCKEKMFTYFTPCADCYLGSDIECVCFACVLHNCVPCECGKCKTCLLYFDQCQCSTNTFVDDVFEMLEMNE